MTEEEKKADQVLKDLRKQYKTEYYNIVNKNFLDTQQEIKSSQLYQILNKMPKGGLLHLHSTGGPSVDTYLKLTYKDFVYFNEREKLFKVAPKGLDEDGYIKCVDMRRFWTSAEQYDNKLRNYMIMTKDEIASKESHFIWNYFQAKQTLISDLARYKEFFKILIHEILQKCSEQNILIVELRHVFGMLFDDDRQPISLEEELSIFNDAIKHRRNQNPNFHLKLIVTGLKLVGNNHIHKMIQSIIEGRKYSDLIAGFDMENEEDFAPPILQFINEILEGKIQDKDQNLPCFFHCGETHDRYNENIFDAILLNTKRIGHGFQLFLQPYLQDIVKQKDICIEACPISNMLLGHTGDLRNHPVRFMLHKGLQATINSDHPGLFGYEGTTMDYFMAFIAWELDIRDLKKLAINGIKYSSLSQPEKKKMLDEVFSLKWKEFVRHLNEEI